MGRQIKTHTREISLAFNPKNKKRFTLMKEGGSMENLINILEADGTLPDQEKITTSLKDLVKDEEALSGVLGALKLLINFKDKIPAGILDSVLCEKDYRFLTTEKKEVNEEELRAKITEELTEKMKKDDEVTIQPLLDRIATLEKDANESKEALVISGYVSMFKDMGVPGDIEGMAKTAATLKKSGDEAEKSYINTLKTMAELSKDATKEVGSAASGSSKGTAYEKLNCKVQEMVKDGKTETEAWTSLRLTHPELVKDYYKEIN